MIEAEPLQQINRTYVRYRGRTLSYFAGCDYFRLSCHPRILKAVGDGLRRYGLNVAASRITTGNHEVFPALEKDLADFFGTECALLTTTGYITNLVAAQGLAGQYSHALVDERAHAALHDASQLLNCPVLTFKHRDLESFAATLKRCGKATRPIVLTDGMFSRDGATAPLKAYLKLLPQDGLLMVDDAHGGGILGKTGKGTVEVENVRSERIVQNVTLSKAFGVYGGAILCSRKLRKKLVSSRLFAGSTPLPLPLAFAARQAIQLMRKDKTLRPRLHNNARFVKTHLRQAGFPLPETPGPIVSIQSADHKKVERIKRTLLAESIFPPFINYHSNPGNGYFRFVISSEHSRAQLSALIQALSPFADDLC